MAAFGPPLGCPAAPSKRRPKFVQPLGSTSEFERELIRERTGAGRIAAMKRGVRFGRPAKLDSEKAALATRLIAEGRSVKEVAKTFGVHKATLYRAAASQDTSIKA